MREVPKQLCDEAKYEKRTSPVWASGTQRMTRCWSKILAWKCGCRTANSKKERRGARLGLQITLANREHFGLPLFCIQKQSYFFAAEKKKLPHPQAWLRVGILHSRIPCLSFQRFQTPVLLAVFDFSCGKPRREVARPRPWVGDEAESAISLNRFAVRMNTGFHTSSAASEFFTRASKF